MSARKARAVQPVPSCSFVKVAADGSLLARDATDWVLVLDRTTDLVFSRGFVTSKHLPWKKAIVAADQFAVGELTGFRAPTYVERIGIFDYTRFDPAMDTDFFDAPEAGWEWTATPYAPSPAGNAWLVNVHYGYSDWSSQGSEGFVRACAPRQSLGILVPEAA